MKKQFVILMVIFLTAISLVYAGEIVIKPNLSSVKVFLRGAEMKHNSKLKLEKGNNEVVFTGITGNVDRNSINVSGKGDGIIISVVQRFDYMRPAEENPEVKKLQDSLETLNKKHFEKQNKIDVLNAQVDLVVSNKILRNEKTGVSIPDLEKMSDYFEKKLIDLKSKVSVVQLDMRRIQKEIEKVNKQLGELKNRLNKPTNEIAVIVSAKNESIFDFELSYILNDAGWQPNYNIRVEKINSPAQINYIANVWQNSGFNWDDVSVVLSTRNPNRNNTKPELYPWLLNFYTPLLGRGVLQKAGTTFDLVSTTSMQEESKAETMANYYEVAETELAVEFTPSLKYSIPSDGKQHSIALQDYSIKASYEYYVVPKLDKNAFLVAKLNDWGDMELLPGEANIYFENSYVGKTYLNPESTKDTMQISLGRDESIVVSRESIRDYSEDKFLSSDVERTFAYEVKIKNNKRNSVKLTVEEQIPVSQTEDIKVKMIDISGGIYNEEIGSVKWNLPVDAGKSTSKKIIFSVRYPKDKHIQGL